MLVRSKERSTRGERSNTRAWYALALGMSVGMALSTTDIAFAKGCAEAPDQELGIDWLHECLADQKYDAVVSRHIKDIVGDDTSDEDLVTIFRMVGSAHLRLEQYEEAIAMFSSAIDIGSPDKISDAWVYWQRCWANARMGYVLAASTDCRQARWKLDDAEAGEATRFDEIQVTSAEAELLYSMGKIEEAINLIEENIEEEEIKSNSEILIQYANIKNRHGDMTEAISLYREALSSGQKYSTQSRFKILNKLANSYYVLGDSRRTSNVLKWALSLEPESDDVLYYICVLEMERGDPPEALEFCQKLYNLNREDIEYVYMYGLSLKKTGRLETLKQTIVDFISRNEAGTHPDAIEKLKALLPTE